MTSKKKTVDRYATFNHVADNAVKEKGLSVADFGFWAYLWRHGTPEGFITIGYSKIMSDLNIKSVHTIRRHFKNLMEADLIGIEQKGSIDNTPTKYWYRKKSKKPPKEEK